MRIHKKRELFKYINNLRKLLSLDNAKNNAIKITTIKTVDGKDYDKCIRIDFIGIAATTLFDIGGIAAKHNIYHDLENLLEKAKEINSEGYFFKVRLLFEYPYSISAYARIQAEYSRNRSSINEPQFLRGLTITEQVDESIFRSSSYIRTQSEMLRNIQVMFEKLKSTEIWNSSSSPNSFVVRFSPIQPGMCCLFINETLFFDVYMFAKEIREEDKCRAFCPVIEINKKTDVMSFSAFEDHFRYIWSLEVTMDCEDATFYKVGTKDSLSKFKPPYQIRFDYKAGRLKLLLTNLQSKDINVWQSGINRVMNRFCANLSPTPSSESIFITCSWEEGDSGNDPHHSVLELYHFLHEDLSQDKSPIASVKILQASLSKFLAPQLYSSMDDSTIGIVILTKDIEDKNGHFYSKPNVYHELGYMMKHLSRDRLIIVAEHGVEIPTNIRDIIRLDFETNKLSLKYIDIILEIKKITSLDNKLINEIIEKLEERLNFKVQVKEITVDEFNSIKREIAKVKNNNKSELSHPQSGFVSVK